jgi:bifunctional DNA-binding transcriptional regulator/antitoxin component of YhaV-PrlF toxin-antitoxin module
VTEVVSVDKAGRIVIPRRIREAAGIDDRAKLLVASAGRGRVVLLKLDVEEIAARLERELEGTDVEALARKVREDVNARIRKAYPGVLG